METLWLRLGLNSLSLDASPLVSGLLLLNPNEYAVRIVLLVSPHITQIHGTSAARRDAQGSSHS